MTEVSTIEPINKTTLPIAVLQKLQPRPKTISQSYSPIIGPYLIIAREIPEKVPTLEDSIEFAEKLKFEGKYKEAVTAYERIINRNDTNRTNINLWNALIKAHFFFEQYDNSVYALNSALKIDNNNPETLYLKGRILEERYYTRNDDIEYLKKAIQIYKTALDNNPPDFLKKKIFKNIGTAYYAMDDIENSITCTQQSLSIDQNYSIAKHNLGMLYISKNSSDWRYWWEEGVKAFESINQKYYINELAEEKYNYYKIKIEAEQLSQKAKKQFPNIKEPMKNFAIVKMVFSSYPKEKIPETINAYWQYFISYIPDNFGDENNIFSMPKYTTENAKGTCDDFVMFAKVIFNAANIPFKILKYEYAPGRIHVACVYNINNKWKYIDVAGLRKIEDSSINNLIKSLKIKSITNKIEIIDIESGNIKITDEIKIEKGR